jgi:DNA mismatch repair ATPase MutS
VYEATRLYHPFIGDKAVRNDFSIVNNNYYIITGANMAGKSTFLRSLGINYILARNGMPVFADSLQVSIYNLFTSMRTSDDLSGGISYFNAELLRLKQLVSLVACPDTTPSEGKGEVLIILDEILKGTNSLDKLNGSRMFLEAMATQSVSGIIATHDLELSKMSDERPDRFHNYCFEIELSNDITYNYKITPGVARNQNATYLLRGVLSDLGVES